MPPERAAGLTARSRLPDRGSLRAIVALVLAWSCLACSPAPPPVPTGSAPRTDSVTVRYWAAGCSVSEDFWRYRKESKTVTCDERGRWLEGEQGVLVWPDYLAATEIDTLTVAGEGLDALHFELWWSTDDSFSSARSLRPAELPADESGSRQVRFDLGRAPEWQGRIRRFRLTWSGHPTPASRVLGAWGTKRAGPSERGG
jgi:hypothetical protein